MAPSFGTAEALRQCVPMGLLKVVEAGECSFLSYFSFKNSTDLVCSAEVIKAKFYFMISCVVKTIIFFTFSPLLQSLLLSSPLLLSPLSLSSL